ncbi:MAG TPA: VWA domain-containing protein [Pirellulales bacterium]|nr:VWA domain-containing protein [Pirellulales bacterium]
MSVAFEHPWYLTLLLFAPVLWALGYRSLASFGGLRRAVILTLRTAVFVLIVLALAQMQNVRTSDRLTVLYLLDQSISIPETQRIAMSEYVNQSIAQHRSAQRQDRAGVIMFAKEPAVENPPVDENLRLTNHAETSLDGSYTNLAGAMRLAMATLPADSAGRVVIVTDGNENLGNAAEEARQLAAHGMGIDVVPIRYQARSEIAVEKLSLPAEIQIGVPFELHVVLANLASDMPEAKSIPAHVQIFRKSDGDEQQLIDQPIELPPGKRVFSLREKIDVANSYTYTARLVPDNPADDYLKENNVATAFTQVRGQGRVLFIVDALRPDDFRPLIERLQHEKLEVRVMTTDDLFASLGQLQAFDTVILADVPREDFTDSQIKMLVTNTQQLGAGLIMLGGPNSFGAGGWAHTELEEALPVDCQVKDPKVRPVNAVALVIDRSGSMTGEKLAMAKAAAGASVDMLSDSDYVTVIAFDAVAFPVVPLVRKGDSQTIKSRIDELGADGGTNMQPAIMMAHEQLQHAADATVRHMVIMTDGETEGSDYPQLIQQLHQEKITTSTVALGADADFALLEQMAHAGGGRYYNAKVPRVLPRIFQQETRLVTRPLVFERESGLQPQIKFPHEILKGIATPPPPITGFVLTTRKENPLVEVPLVSPLPVEDENRSLLATWTYGLGKVVAFTTDAGHRWASRWTDWSDYDKLFSQMVRWSLRPAGNQGQYVIDSEVRDGKLRLTINAFDQNDNYLNFLTPSGSVIGPDMRSHAVQLRQTAPGRYVGEVNVPDAGSYFFTLTPSPGSAPILSGVNVPYSSEFLDRQSNDHFLAELAGITPAGGRPGRVIQDEDHYGLPGLLSADVFRHDLRPAVSSQDAWPQLLLWASYVFLCDIIVRRVRFNFGWLVRLPQRIRNRFLRRQTPAVIETIARLRSRKAAVVESVGSQKSSLRWEPVADGHEFSRGSTTALLEATTMNEDKALEKPPMAAAAGEEAASEEYTTRLLKAKQQISRQLDRH